MPQVLSELGELLAHGLAVKPGKTLFTQRGKPVFGPPQPGGSLFYVSFIGAPAHRVHAWRGIE